MNKLFWRNSKLLVLLFTLILFVSCKTPRSIIYFQDTQNDTEMRSIISDSSSYEITIQPADLLTITVSSIDPNAVAIFNLPATTFLTPGNTELSTTPVMQTYLVDTKGNIDFPVLGRIKASGLTRIQLADYIKEKINIYVKEPLVNVQIINFKISVLGEVNSPGTKSVNGERITILDAISLAGDLTINGKRSNALLIRENGIKKDFYRFDLTSSDLFSSPYFYLKQNDIIYIEPNKAKQNSSRIDSRKQFNVSVASTITGVIATIASLCIALFIK
ncbi:polysaccharide biosynthesis/export family protein [Bacteroides salyersiae]|jgi:polysaccharide export outer membrane protein|uniref:polysaccharide biosynthesis/export family protein n=1 Tax=Bacteroides salyersiae TaxID=291644 RepID=UPI001C8BBA40|nr:polysaccharide biosynthesis/export family protein [Bacteroides salyersiae]